MGVNSLNASHGGSLAPKVWRAADLPTCDGPLPLETHVWIWHLDGDTTQLAPDTVGRFDRSVGASRLHVSDISYWEVAVKSAKQKLTLSVDAAIWLHRSEHAPGIRFLPLDRDRLMLSTRLPGTMYNDPADRMLIAAAQINNIPLFLDADWPGRSLATLRSCACG